jgi:hypothetical protein
MAGITGHNIAVLYVLSDQSDKALPLFRQAVKLKQIAFGAGHPEVAVSLKARLRANNHTLSDNSTLLVYPENDR